MDETAIIKCDSKTPLRDEIENIQTVQNESTKKSLDLLQPSILSKSAIETEQEGVVVSDLVTY